MMHVVLVEPEIPQNTGNIARTCAATGSHLHLIRPLGFEISDRYLKRAGLDYWHLMTYDVYDCWDAFLAANPGCTLHFASTKSAICYTQARYCDGDYLVFGKETKGLSEELLAANYDRCIRIPMVGEARSLNLSNSVAVVLYEALRQQGFPGLNAQGRLGAVQGQEWRDYV